VFYGYVYKTTNLINGKIYIGQKKGNFNCYYLGSGKILQKSIKKHGKINFKVEILEYANGFKHLNELEIKYIALYKQITKKGNIYNIAIGGTGAAIGKDNCFYGKKHSEKSINQMKLKKKGPNNPMFGLRHTQETKNKMSEKQLREKGSGWKGEFSTVNGYTIKYCPEHPFSKNKYIRFHNEVIEKYLGKFLLPGQEVCHVNGNRSDNSITNLIAFETHSALIKFKRTGILRKEEVIFDGRDCK
jgi:group I intron endonuclease